MRLCPQPVIGLEAVAADDLVLLVPEQPPGDRGGAMAGDGEDRGQRGDRHRFMALARGSHATSVAVEEALVTSKGFSPPLRKTC